MIINGKDVKRTGRGLFKFTALVFTYRDVRN